MKLICLDTFPATLHHESGERREELTEVQDFESGDLLGYLAPEMVAPVANALQACHGLDLPADVPPGILAELVTAARQVSENMRLAGGDAQMKTGEGLLKIGAIIAKLTPTPDPAKP